MVDSLMTDWEKKIKKYSIFKTLGKLKYWFFFVSKDMHVINQNGLEILRLAFLEKAVIKFWKIINVIYYIIIPQRRFSYMYLLLINELFNTLYLDYELLTGL